MGDLAIPTKERLLSIIELQNAIASMNAPADDVMRLAAERAVGLSGATGGVVALVEGDELVVRAAVGSARHAQGTRTPLADAPAARSITERRAHAEGTYGFIPILYGEHAVGVMTLAGDQPVTDEDLDTVKLLATIVAIALHKAHAYPRPRMDNSHDAATGLENRRAFEDRVQTELGRSRRYGQSFSLAVLHLHGFRAATDRLGQATGDQILRDVAGILKAQTRVIDACFRIANEEFAIVMPGTSPEGANILADRCRAQIAEAGLGDRTIHSSFGVVAATNETEADELITRASQALATDKESQRVS